MLEANNKIWGGFVDNWVKSLLEKIQEKHGVNFMRIPVEAI